ncbi:hypothetical protein ACJJTC_008027 [Scirpophaga incertulas]
MSGKISPNWKPNTIFTSLFYKRKRNKPELKNEFETAFKVWTTLTDEEKEKFRNKIKDCKTREKNKLAEKLKNIKPFLKKKECIRRFSEDVSKQMTKTKRLTIHQVNAIEINHAEPSENIIASCEDVYDSDQYNETVLQDRTISMDGLNDQPEQEEFNEADENYISQVKLVEPSAPSVRNSRELYELIKSSSGVTAPWSSLSRTQKSRYQRAVFSLKADYIKQFKAYLESLSSKELLQYYNNYC